MTAVVLRPNPLPQDAAAKWALAARAWGTPHRGSTYAIEEAPSPNRTIPLGAAFDIAGWAFDPRTLRTADHVVYAVDGGGWRFAAYNQQRPDVAQRLRIPNVADSGFRAHVETRDLRAGVHTFTFATVNGATYVNLPDRVVVHVRAR